mmetsp:Transcript_99468/g.172665  ORF Transcript_99468/g.172665 Transcript_99468/m.172665 type:complete len:312 (-) Transcript_99468:175-1110(-)
MGNNIFHVCTNAMNFDDGDPAMILRIVEAPIMDTMGAKVSGFKLGDELQIALYKCQGLQPLSWRYRDNHKSGWPSSYRYQTVKTSMLALVDGPHGNDVQCVLQVPAEPSEQTLDNVRLDVMDASAATSYASRFNTMMLQSQGHQEMNAAPEVVPTVKICAPVACEVMASTSPDILPRGSFCTLALYPHREVKKFVFEGREEFLEVPQAFFHFAVFLSGSKELVSDLQGMDDDSGGLTLLDPIVFRTEQPSVGTLLSTMMTSKKDNNGSSADRVEQLFNGLHPNCCMICGQFDPGRRGPKGKKGMCGITCMH